MPRKSRIYIAASPEILKNVRETGKSIIHLSYEMRKGPTLFRSAPASAGKGGVLSISDAYCDDLGDDYESFSRQIFAELSRRAMDGVFFDFVCGNQALYSLLYAVCPTLTKYKIPVFVPHMFADALDGTIAVVPTDTFSGSLSDYLAEMCGKYTTSRIAVEVVRARHDYPLPFSHTSKTELTPSEIEQLSASHGAASYFSADLLARYFTYTDSAGAPHFVLYDDASTIKEKLSLIESLQIPYIFLLYSEMHDIF